MIQANELRIGNLVKYGVHIVPIKSIHKSYDNEVTVYVKLNEKLNHYCLYIDEVDPIQITEELLLKFGFEISNEGWFGYAEKNKVKFDISSLSEEIVLQDFNGKRVAVKYIHQLQNLYYSLMQTELEINE
jgi:hypothetical protein